MDPKRTRMEKSLLSQAVLQANHESTSVHDQGTGTGNGVAVAIAVDQGVVTGRGAAAERSEGIATVKRGAEAATEKGARVVTGKGAGVVTEKGAGVAIEEEGADSVPDADHDHLVVEDGVLGVDRHPGLEDVLAAVGQCHDPDHRKWR